MLLLCLQVQEVYDICAGLNWPSEVAPAPQHPQLFYEGAFLAMLFGKLTTMLDQVWHVTPVWPLLCHGDYTDWLWYAYAHDNTTSKYHEKQKIP